jgi:phosphoglycerate dehydrogenase-like enzyme
MGAARVIASVPLAVGGQAPARDLLRQAGYDLIELAGSRPDVPEEVRTRYLGVAAILAGMEPLNGTTLAAASDLRVIARSGVGFDTVDVAWCTAHGIVVTNTPGALSDAVAEETMALMLALTRHLVTGNQSVKAGGYDVPYGDDLGTLVLGVIGGGHIGSEVIRRALAFGMRVLCCDPGVPAARLHALGAQSASLAELLPQADIVTLHLPLTPQTRQLVNADFLAQMKPGSRLLNTARGGLVDEAALIEALNRGHLAGAGLDCQASEPPTGRSLDLVRLPQVVAMPHAGSKTTATRQRMALWAARSIDDVLQGRTPEHVVNPQVLPSLRLARR